MKELISIVIPVYNVKEFLGKCLDSIIKQSYSNIEIIVVDDGSTDGSAEICDDYKNKDTRIKVIHQANQGLSAARNTGINSSNGDYIVFCDSDDWLDVETIKKLHSLIKKDGASMAACARYKVYMDSKNIPDVKEKFEKVFDFEEAIKEMNLYRYFDMAANGKMFKTSLLRKYLFPVGKKSEDFFVMYKIIRDSGKVSYTSECLYYYLQRPGSITKNKNINTDFLEAAKCQMDDLSPLSKKLEIITRVAYASAALTVVDFYIKNKVKCSSKDINEYKKIVSENYWAIKKHDDLSTAKRIQFKLFLISYLIYKGVFTAYRKIKRG